MSQPKPQEQSILGSWFRTEDFLAPGPVLWLQRCISHMVNHILSSSLQGRCVERQQLEFVPCRPHRPPPPHPALPLLFIFHTSLSSGSHRIANFHLLHFPKLLWCKKHPLLGEDVEVFLLVTSTKFYFPARVS